MPFSLVKIWYDALDILDLVTILSYLNKCLLYTSLSHQLKLGYYSLWRCITEPWKNNNPCSWFIHLYIVVIMGPSINRFCWCLNIDSILLSKRDNPIFRVSISFLPHQIRIVLFIRLNTNTGNFSINTNNFKREFYLTCTYNNFFFESIYIRER